MLIEQEPIPQLPTYDAWDVPDQIPDDWFDFIAETAEEYASDSLYMSALQASYERVVASGDLERIAQATAIMAKLACDHSHQQESHNLNDLHHKADLTHNSDEHERHHDKDCKVDKNGTCSCKRSSK